MANQASSNLDRAKAAWGKAMPRHIVVLAEACDRLGRTKVTQELGLSSSTISRILANGYNARQDHVADLIMAQLSPDVVRCPVFNDDLPIRTCQLNRRRTDPPDNQLRRMYAAACPACVFNTDNRKDAS